MSDWNIMDYEDLDVDVEIEEPVHRGKHINKEKFCKKNKIGNGQYGPHNYVDKRCTMCDKIDPRVKNKNNRIEEIINNE